MQPEREQIKTCFVCFPRGKQKLYCFVFENLKTFLGKSSLRKNPFFKGDLRSLVSSMGFAKQLSIFIVNLEGHMFRVGNVFVSFQCGFCSYFLAILFSAYTGFSSIMAICSLLSIASYCYYRQGNGIN